MVMVRMGISVRELVIILLGGKCENFEGVSNVLIDVLIGLFWKLNGFVWIVVVLLFLYGVFFFIWRFDRCC